MQIIYTRPLIILLPYNLIKQQALFEYYISFTNKLWGGKFFLQNNNRIFLMEVVSAHDMVEGSGFFPAKPMNRADWVISSESGHCPNA